MYDLCLVSKVWRHGTGWYAQLLAQAIADAGGNIAFVSPLASPESREPHGKNIDRHTISREIVGSAPRLRRAIASLRRSCTSVAATLALSRRAKVFVFSIPEPFLFSLPLFATLRLLRTRVILIVHDVKPHVPRSGLTGLLERWVNRAYYSLSSHLVVLSSAAAGALKSEFRIPSRRVSVIPHGLFSLTDVKPIPGDSLLLAFGTIRRNKNVLETIIAVKGARAQGASVRLVVAGEPHPLEPEYWDECMAAMIGDEAAFEVDRRFIPDEDLPKLLSRVDAFVLAYENFDSQSGVAVLAAISARPVIGTESGGLADLFALGMAGERLPEQVSAEAIETGIMAFLRRPISDWREEANLSALRVAEHLSWSAIGQRFLKLARDLNHGR